MVLPFFEYGGLFLEACEPRFRDKLHRLFCRGIRIALNNYYDFFSAYDLHTEINFLPLSYRRAIMICKFMFKQRGCDGFELLSAAYATRLHDGPVLKVPDVSNEKFKRFLPWLGPSTWNGLPIELRNQECYSRFVSELKSDLRVKFYFDQTFR